MLVDSNLMTPEQASAIQPGEAFNQLVALSGRTADDLTQFMYHHHNVAAMWEIMACIGFITALLILAYSVWWAKTGTSAAVAVGAASNETESESKEQA